jgi:cardiolipin synthase
VHIIVPRRNDSMIARITNDYYLHKLMRHGIQVSVYDRGFIHGKYLIVDSQLALVGTVNWDVLSFFRSYEITGLFDDEKTIQQLANDFTQNLADSTPY